MAPEMYREIPMTDGRIFILWGIVMYKILNHNRLPFLNLENSLSPTAIRKTHLPEGCPGKRFRDRQMPGALGRIIAKPVPVPGRTLPGVRRNSGKLWKICRPAEDSSPLLSRKQWKVHKNNQWRLCCRKWSRRRRMLLRKQRERISSKERRRRKESRCESLGDRRGSGGHCHLHYSRDLCEAAF